MSQVTLNNNLRRKACLIIVNDVNMTSKRAFLQKVTVLLNLTTEKMGFAWCFSVTTITMENA